MKKWIPPKSSARTVGGSPDSCGHLLAHMDMTFAGEGKFGLGLLGGSLYNVQEIRTLRERLEEAGFSAAKTLQESFAPRPWFRPSKCAGHYVDQVELLISDNPYIHRDDVQAEVDPYIVHEFFEELVASECQTWYCKDAEKAAKAVRAYIRKLLEKAGPANDKSDGEEGEQ